MKNILKFSFFVAVSFLVLVAGTHKVLAAPTLSSEKTVTNVVQVLEVKAARTLTVASAVASSTGGTTPSQMTIGSCLVTFATTTSGTARFGAVIRTSDDLDCTDNAALILLATSSLVTDYALTVAQTAQELRGLKNVIDANHGSLAVSGSGSNIIFTATSTEASETNITFATTSLNAISNSVTTNTPTTGVIPVAARAQVVVFTPSNMVDYIYTITINSVDYAYIHRRGELKDLVEALKAAMPSTPVSCTEDDTAITCTAVTPGTEFTYSTSITSSPTESTSSASGSSGRNSGGGGGGSYTAPVVKVTFLTSGGLTAEQIQSIKNQISALLQLIARLQQRLLRMQNS